ncbi:hypothetical protein FTV88_0147 [Heliorestis convoluta]|uniref:Uncharacterized protein n=1 Tax=Heliorestis convoluta TaxID=356322 RepID=A0A5Q2MYU2_9FIRM|nr:hypothetical protein FTV88_0147 [Heliorestis convoluta]
MLTKPFMLLFLKYWPQFGGKRRDVLKNKYVNLYYKIGGVEGIWIVCW